MTALHRSLRRAAGARVFALSLGTICTMASSYLIIRFRGLDAFGAVTLISAMVALVPFADLGAGSAVVNAAADHQSQGNRSLERILRAALRLTACAGVILAAVAVSLYAMGSWTDVLGDGARVLGNPEWAATALFVVVAVTIPIGLGQRVLIGSSRVATANLLQLIAPVVSLAVVCVASALTLPDWLYAIAPALGAFVAAVVISVAAMRVVSLRVRDVLFGPTERAAYRSVLTLGMPSLVVATGAALAFQSHRLVLSHVSTSAELAYYALVAPVWLGMTSVVAVAGQTLWPHYRGLRHRGELGARALLRDVRLFAAVGVAGGAGVLSLGPVLIFVQTSGMSSIPWAALGGAALLLCAQSALLPAAMLLTEPREMAVQAVLVGVMAIMAFAGAVVFCPAWGAAGAYVSAAVAVAFGQLPGTLLAACRQLSRQELAAPLSGVPTAHQRAAAGT